MHLITSIEDAQMVIRDHEGPPEELELQIADSLVDPAGINMATITDLVLARGWKPAGYEQRDGYRVYRYQEWG